MKQLTQIAMVATIEVNLILWLAMLGCLFSESMATHSRSVVIVGLLFAAIAQHWSYYQFRKLVSRTKEKPA